MYIDRENHTPSSLPNRRPHLESTARFARLRSRWLDLGRQTHRLDGRDVARAGRGGRVERYELREHGLDLETVTTRVAAFDARA